jgi:hypothetical protein
MKTALSKFFAWMGKAQSEDNGSPSAMRVNTTNLAIQWTTAITFISAWTAVYHPEYVLALSSMIICGILGALGVKVYQKGKEQDVPTSEVK